MAVVLHLPFGWPMHPKADGGIPASEGGGRKEGHRAGAGGLPADPDEGDQFPFQQPLPEVPEGVNDFMRGGNPVPPAVAAIRSAEGESHLDALP